jgi:hypothetical protein
MNILSLIAQCHDAHQEHLLEEEANLQVSISSRLYYRAFHRFGQAKFTDGGSILDSSQGTLNRGSVGWQMSTCFLLAVCIMKKIFCLYKNDLF